MIKKKDKKIISVNDWAKFAGPKDKVQWKEYRSAMESAIAWFRSGKAKLPTEIEELLKNHSSFGPVKINEVEPEALLRFDSYSGPSNMDVLVKAEDEKGNFIIGIEAKADETFSEYLVGEKFSSALEERVKNSNSRQIERIIHLSEALFSTKNKVTPKISDLRYQLLTGLAGTICKTIEEGCSRGIFLIHEFNTPLTTEENHIKNARDLNAFINRLTAGRIKELSNGNLIGPIKFPGLPLFDSKPDIYIGKITVKVAEKARGVKKD